MPFSADCANPLFFLPNGTSPKEKASFYEGYAKVNTPCQ